MNFKKLITSILVMLMVTTLITGCGEAAKTEFPDPEKTITMIVPHGAGGGTDTHARQLVEAMKEVSGNNNIIVENVTGGSSGTGTNQVIDSNPDGYNLLMYGSYVICGTMTGYTDGFKELDFLNGLTMEPFVLAVKKDSPYETFKDLVDAAQANEGEITLGNAGATATTGILGYGLNNALGGPFNVVSFNGGAELIPAVLGDHCDAGIFSQSEVISNMDGFRPLIFFEEGRSVLEELKDVPNLAEAGYPELEVPGGCFRGITTAKGTPEEVKVYLADLIEEAYNTDTFQNYLLEQGFLEDYSRLEEFEKYNQELVDEMQPIIQSTGLASDEYAD